MEAIHKQVMKPTLKTSRKVLINYNSLCIAACVVYFAQDAIRVLIGTALPIFGSNSLTWFMIFLMYAPLVASYLMAPSKVGPAIRRFIVLLVLTAAFFLVTYLIHPEYESWFFEGSYKIGNWIFRPNQFIYAFLFISIVKDPKDALKALKVVGYLLLAYYTYKILRARAVGYWITTTTASGPQHAAYDLNYGYDHLFVFAIFLGCGFKEKKPLYFVLSAISFIEILLGGSRGPLLAIAIMLILMYFRYRQDLSKFLRVIIIFGAIVLALLYIALGFEGSVILFGSLLSRIVGSSSRTIQTLLGGSSALDSSGRDRLYNMAIEMIKNGFWGYGAYGDRYVIGRVFWVGYVHNIVFEILIDFGWILGGFFIAKMAIALIKMLLQCKDDNWYMLFMIFLIPSIKLFLSGSFWFLEAFWAAIAVYQMYQREVKRGNVV